MEPVRIRYWGVSLTRRGYLMSLAVAAALVVAVFIVGALLGGLPPLSSLWQPMPVKAQTPAGYWFLLFHHNLYRIVVVCLVVFVVDTLVTLRRFAAREAERHAQLKEQPPDPTQKSM
jgi:hypothetical protein